MDINNVNLLHDAKLKDAELENYIRKEYDKQNIAENSFKRLMLSFQYFNENKFEKHYENRSFAESFYNELQWDGSYFDVINSFWTTFQSALVALSASELNKKTEAETSFSYIEGEKRDMFAYKTKYNNQTPIGKEKLVKKIIDNKNSCNKTIQIYIKDKNWYMIENFSALCHCVANFMPCPSSPFNSAKGLLSEVKDYLPLMIDKIQECVEYNKEMQYQERNEKETIVDIETIKNWKKWFINNREKYCLQPYYYVEQKEVEEPRIVGIPFFKKQSLKYPLPKEMEEVKECLTEILNRIKCRATLIEEKHKI